jgi:prolyl oligopeptidase
MTAHAAPPQAPPIAPVHPVTDDYHGTKIVDPYRYMENLADPEVQAWVKAQGDYASQTLKAIAGRDALLARVRELDQGAPYRLWILRRWPNGDLHYLKSLATENLDKLYFRDAATGQERLLIDPEKMGDAASGKHVALEFCRPSPDKRYVAYGLAAAGSEQTVLHVLDTTTDKELAETIDRMESDYTPPFWLGDGQSFVYSRRQKLPAGAPPTEVYKLSRACLHKLGSDPNSDPVVFAKDASPRVAMSDADFPSLILPSTSRWAFGKIKHGDTDELTLYAAPIGSLAQPAAEIPWVKICDVADQISDFAVHDDDVYLLSAANASRYKVLKTGLTSPNLATASTVMPEGASVIQGIMPAKDALYVTLLEAGVHAVVRLPYSADAKPQRITAPPGEVSASPIAANPDTPGVFIATESWTRRGRIYAYDPAAASLTDTRLRPLGKFDDVPGYESHEVMVTSHDGVKIPLSILHKTGLALDGSHPTLINGYGAYGHVMHVNFNPVRLAWLERGGVLAFAHVRGGGEFGKAWHQAGQMATKPNTWLDLIACGEYLCKQGYTTPAKLAGQGGSAGGILIGRAITARPDLFAAALINVGCTDMLRMETTTNGVPNIAEFGSTRTKAGFDALLAMSALHNVKDGVKYPAVLLTHGINDPRVEPWESAKMTARLQAATASGKPVLFRVDYDAGHGIGSTKSQRQEETADQWAFLLWQMGELR